MDLEFSSEKSMKSEAPGAQRAPYAFAASCAVMLAGAGFLAFVISQTPSPAAPAGNEPSTEVRITLAPIDGDPTAEIRRAQQSLLSTPTSDLEIGGTVETSAPAPLTTASAMNSADNIENVEVDFSPRVKPSPPNAAADAARQVAMQAPPLLELGDRYLASDYDRPPPFFFLSDIVRLEAPARPLAIRYAGDVGEGPRIMRVALTKGETFVDALRRAGVRAADRNAAAYAFGKLHNLRALLPGQEFILTLGEENQTLFQIVAREGEPDSYLVALQFKTDAENRIILSRLADGAFEARKAAIDLTSRLVSVKGRIDGSLYVSAKNAGAPDIVIASLADIFAYDIDFQRDILGGDEFEAIFEVRYDENGAPVDAGDIVYGRLTWRGRAKEKGYYRHAAAGGRADYFDRAGEGARRLLMKTPIDGARLSSGFGARRHPIYGYTRAHKGVDFAASTGTPIKAAGSGVVERAGPYGGFGNYLRIRHASGYQTVYGHLSRYARGMRAGKRVSQGDIVGYVGSTGAATGPHLHYEVHLNGVAVNPQKLKIATGVALKGEDLQAFKAQRDLIDALRLPAQEADVIASQDGEASAL
ncbi:MAG: M23 family metallopeptidase, partial [Parvularculaceae bacterium]